MAGRSPPCSSRASIATAGPTPRWRSCEAPSASEHDARLRFAEHVIEQRERTTVVLAELGAELSSLVRLDDFGAAINRAADHVAGCDATIVVELHDSRVRLRSNSGIDDQLTAGVAAIDVGDQGPIGHVLTDGRPRYFETKSDLLEQHPVLARIIAPGLYHAWGAVPILNDGVPLGAIVCHWQLPTRIPEVTRGALEELGRIAGLALGRLREQETARLLAEIEAALSASATVEQVVQVATDLVTPLLGAFTVDLSLLEGGSLLTLSSERLAVAGIDVAPADRPIASAPIRRTEMVHLTPTSDWSRFPALARAREITGAAAMLSQPVLSNGSTLGILTATYLDERDCGPYERHRATEVSVMLGRAIRRAALLDRERLITNELQRSILPDTLPGVSGYTVVARYLGAESGVDVGGDWFDCFRLERDRLALVVGDIVGHGLHAAGATGQLRSACRAVADLSEGPADVVGRLDHFAMQTPNTRFATLFYAELAPETGSVSFCRAGHLPPVLVDADGRTEILENDGSWLIGLEHPGPRTQSGFEIPRGGRLVVFTDGIVERRGESVDAGYRRLCDSITRRAALHGDELAAAIVSDMSDESATDDRCLLIIERL